MATTFKQYLAEQGQLDELFGFGKKESEDDLMKKRLALRNKQRDVEAQKRKAASVEQEKAKALGNNELRAGNRGARPLAGKFA